MTTNAAEDAAVAAGLADTIEPDGEPVVVEVDTSGERDDDGIAVDAEVLQLPVRLEPSEATVAGMSLVPVRDELKGLTELAVTLAIADNTPYALKGKPAAVLAVFLTGRELGIPPMTALRNLHVIDGKVTVNPKVRAAMVRREGLGKLWPHQGPREVIDPESGETKIRLCECGRSEPDNDDEMCTWHAKRADDPWVIYSSTYTMGMARGVTIKVKDGNTQYLADKDNWKNYPERMLSWRSLGHLLDDAFPEVGTGLYSPDELGAITDEEGEPVIDVASTEVLTEVATRERNSRRGVATGSGGTPGTEAPASPDTLTTFKARIEKIKCYEGAADALKALWQADNGNGGPKLPPVDHLKYKDCKMAAAMLDSIEKRINKGEFGEEITDAVIVEDGDAGQAPGQVDGSGSEPTAEGEDHEAGVGATEGAVAPQDAQGDAGPPAPDEPAAGQEGAQEPATGANEPDPGPPPFDPEGLPAEYGHAQDLQWCERAPEGLIQEVSDGVQELKADELLGVMKLLDMSANGMNEATKRARIAARRVRLRMERMLSGG